jgi:hypothetical protein
MGKNKVLWAICGLGIIAALFLAIAHWIDLCTKECAEGHNWSLFGLPFELVGIALFIVLGLLWLGKWYFLLGFGLLASLGSEIYFIYVQATKMSNFCPLCLATAACLAISTLTFFIGRFYTMKTIYLSVPAILIGFIAAFFGVAKIDQLQAAQSSIEKSLAFGQTESPVEVYLFTDWACPACRKLEPELGQIVPVITDKAKFYFVDHVIHPETLNFIPYNLSFMIHNKDTYIQIRDILTEISKETGSPEEKQIEEAVGKIGVKYNQLNYADVALGIRFFKELGQKYKIQGTPTMILINRQTKKGKKLSGTDEITVKGTTDAINSLIADGN